MRFIVHLKGQAKGQDEWIYAIHKTQKKKKKEKEKSAHIHPSTMTSNWSITRTECGSE